jgi:AraC-like DNA-binding protein
MEWGIRKQMTAILVESPRFLSAAQLENGDILQKTIYSNTNYTSILLLQEGKGVFNNDKQILIVHESDLLVIHPQLGCSFHPHMEKDFKAILITFSNLHVSGLPKGYLLEPQLVPIFQKHADFISINRYCNEIFHEYTTHSFGSEEFIACLLRTLLILLIRSTNRAVNPVSSTVPQIVKGYIEENYVVDLSLNDLASVVYVSPYHLAHLFKMEIGMSPIQYLIKCRIDKAKKLLAGTNLSVQEISVEVGYPNANYFNLLFKKIVGESPGKFRKK